MTQTKKKLIKLKMLLLKNNYLNMNQLMILFIKKCQCKALLINTLNYLMPI